jgi:sulfate adenylyltransferase large subunit
MTDLLRLSTAGSVDDGKSTLIGRLLYDSKALLADQLDHLQQATERRGGANLDLSLFADGLKSEREQGITIDVAHLYFTTPRRRFIIADTPGHVQYTRNMVTGTSNSDLAIILLDARKGVREQTRRHYRLAQLLGVRHVVVSVNKMDLVDYSKERFEDIREEIRRMTGEDALSVIIPMSALLGENVVSRTTAMPWHDGPSLLEYLETVLVSQEREAEAVRFPVQYVIRPGSGTHPDYRGYAGRLFSGTLRPGDAVQVLPSGRVTTVRRIERFGAELEILHAGETATLLLEEDLDISRGDLLAAGPPPQVTQSLEAELCWMDTAPLVPGKCYELRHTTRSTRCVVKEILHRTDIHTGKPADGEPEIQLNDLGRVRLKTMHPLVVDDYRRHREGGAFILVDEKTHFTAAAGMVRLPNHAVASAFIN